MVFSFIYTCSLLCDFRDKTFIGQNNTLIKRKLLVETVSEKQNDIVGKSTGSRARLLGGK